MDKLLEEFIAKTNSKDAQYEAFLRDVSQAALNDGTSQMAKQSNGALVLGFMIVDQSVLSPTKEEKRQMARIRQAA